MKNPYTLSPQSGLLYTLPFLGLCTSIFALTMFDGHQSSYQLAEQSSLLSTLFTSLAGFSTFPDFKSAMFCLLFFVVTVLFSSRQHKLMSKMKT